MFLGFNKRTTQVVEQCYYVAIASIDGWETINEMKNEIIKDVITILVDYDHLPIRYKFCLDYSNKDCPILALSKVEV
jgi:hypothetical protein